MSDKEVEELKSLWDFENEQELKRIKRRTRMFNALGWVISSLSIAMCLLVLDLLLKA
jgi:hypothetical protein